MTKYSVIIPTYNERRNIGILYLLLREAFAHPSLRDDEFEITVVDDNSPDGTADVVAALQREFGDKNLLLRPRAGKLGLGTAYVHGLTHATGEFVIIMDADLSHHPSAIPKFVAEQRASGCDVVTGTRYVPGGGVHGWDTRRKLTSRVANYLAHVLLAPGVSDLTGSFRLYRKDAMLDVVSRVKSRGYVFQMEIMVRCKKAGLKVREVPIAFVDRVYGSSKLGGAEIVGYLKGLLRLFMTV
jgi:dolichol-phosphate mannosyltransferase